MVKKVFSWAKTTELWIILAQIYTVFLCFYIVKCQLWGGEERNKWIGIVFFVTLLLLVYRYELYRLLSFKLYALFFIFTYIAGIVQKAPILKVVGSATQRIWYLYLLALAVGCALKGKKKDRWIYVMFVVQSVILSVVFSISIYGAVRKLMDPEYETIKGFGYFLNGRLATFMSPNTGGPAGVVLILLGVLLIYRSREMRFKALLNIIYSVFVIIGWAELGLTRSRGSMIAAGIAVGVFFFVIVYDKYKEKPIKAFFAGAGVCLATAVLGFALLCLPKVLFDKAVTVYVESVHSSESERINEALEVYSLTYAIDNLTDRTEIWRATIGMLNEKPERWIWGMTSQQIYNCKILDVYENRPEISATTAHNGYLEQLYTYGIPGAAILALILIVWIINAFRVAFSPTIETKEKTMVMLMAAALVNAMVEAFLFPFRIFYPISFYFFMSEGCVEGSLEMKKWSLKKKIAVLCGFTIFAAVVALFTRDVYLKSKAEYENVKEIEIKEQNPDDYIRLNNGISPEMMSADYWIKLRESQGADTGETVLSLAEIERLNYINRRMISTGIASFSLKEIDEVFYYKVAKSLVIDLMFKEDETGDLLVNGQPTDDDYWGILAANANVDALTERIDVKFGVSVTRSVLKKYPTDDNLFSRSSTLYYDEMVQSDFPPFIPVAVLHESADSEWYYVITYGYGGWIRKECIALCESKEDWVSRFEPEDFLVVTGRELRIPTDPYTEELSDLSVPMGTKLPIVSLEEAPEEIHGRIGFGNYIAKLPTRNEDGTLKDCYVLIPATEDVHLGYLPYTEENVVKLAFKHLGAGYGWAGDNNGLDCSGFTRAVYSCFGFEMPRSTNAQAEMECTGAYDVSGKGFKETMNTLKDAKIGTLLYFQGHIMMYLGTEDGRPYCISSVGNFATSDMADGEIREVNTVILTDMLDTKRADGKSWIESVSRIVVP